MKRFLLILLFFVLMFGFLFFQSCKKSSSDGSGTDGGINITGNWNLTITFKNKTVVTKVITFEGTATEGTYKDDQGDRGTYRVGDVTVYFTKTSNAGIIQYYIGVFSDANNMSGSFIGTDTGTGTWSAAR